MDTIDMKYIIAEVAACHGVKIDADDPMIAIVSLNQLALMDLMTPLIESMKLIGSELEESPRMADYRRSEAQVEEVRQAAAALRAEIQNNVERARANFYKSLVLELNEVRRRVTRLRAVSLICAAIIFSFGFWMGWKL
jgi:hypothetical protein